MGIRIIRTTEAIILDDSIRADNFLSNEVEEFISWLKKHIPPISYTFCLDISGSMNEEVSGNYTKIDFLKSIVKHVIHSAIPELFGITLITFNNNVSLEFKELIKDDYNKHLLIKKVENLSAFGTTALQDAIYIAFQENHSVNEDFAKVLIVVTDGYENDSSVKSSKLLGLIKEGLKSNRGELFIAWLLGKKVDKNFFESLKGYYPYRIVIEHIQDEKFINQILTAFVSGVLSNFGDILRLLQYAILEAYENQKEYELVLAHKFAALALWYLLGRPNKETYISLGYILGLLKSFNLDTDFWIQYFNNSLKLNLFKIIERNEDYFLSFDDS